MKARFFVSEILNCTGNKKPEYATDIYGYKAGEKLAIGMFYIVGDNEEILFSYKAISGGWGKPIGPGEFKFSYFTNNSEIQKLSNKEAYTQFGLGWFALIEDKDGRFALGAHPDGNVPGSLGCIVFNFKSDVDNTRAHNLFRDALSDGMKMPLTVFYNLQPKVG